MKHKLTDASQERSSVEEEREKVIRHKARNRRKARDRKRRKR